MRRGLLLGALILLLAACSDAEPPKPDPSIPVYDYGGARGPGSLGTHVIQAGDTFDSIAERYGVAKKDLLAANHLKPGDVVHSGTRLLLPRPPNYQAREGDTIKTVAQMFELPEEDIAKLNKLDGPYMLEPGQTISLPRQRLNTLVQQVMAAPFTPPMPQPKPFRDAPLTPVQTANRDHVLKLPERYQHQQQQLAVLTPPPAKPLMPPQPEIPKAQPVAAVTAPPREVPQGRGMMAPVVGKVVAKYGALADGRQNDGINIAAPAGTPVQAAERGRVVFSGDDIPGYGNMVLIQHDRKIVTVYAHLGRNMVRKGDTVEKGDIIGTVGQTGAVTSPQLHFEVREGKATKNPASVVTL